MLTDQAFEVSADAAAGSSVGIAQAVDAEPNAWAILGGSGAELFAIDPATGVISVAGLFERLLARLG